jgi:hypothetical protein
MENPEKRVFSDTVQEYFMAARPELVAAGLTIMRAFVATKIQPRELVPQWGGFERWNDMVRAPLVWLGCADPCDSQKAIQEQDPERNRLLQFMEAWDGMFGPSRLRPRMRYRTGRPDPRTLSPWLKKHSERPLGGRQFVQSGTRSHVALWKLENTGGTPKKT